MRHLCGLALATFWAVFFLQPTSGQDTGDSVSKRQADDAAKIAAAVEAYTSAFNSRSAADLTKLWTTDGAYVTRSTGEQLRGHDELGKRFAEILSADPAPKLVVSSESIEFISPRVAVERGRATVTVEGDASETSYTAVYVKEGDQWLIDRITEDAVAIEETRYEKLRVLEWLIGDWVDYGDAFTIEIDCDWTANQNFISRTYSVTFDDGTASSGLQIIGWDQSQEQIRSWLFDSDGGFVGGTWTPRDDQWVVQSVATLADGSNGSFTSIFQPLPDGNYTWQKVNRVLDGKLLPNIDAITIQRQ